MNKEEIIQFSKKIGSTTWNYGGRSIVVQCPFAKWTHQSGRDRHPSCSIFIEEDDMSSFICHTCKRHGTISDMVAKLNHFRKGGLEELQVWVEKVNKPNLLNQLDRAVNKTEIETKPEVDFTDEELKPFAGSVPRYIFDRGIELFSCKLWELGYDKNPTDPRLVFPVRDVDYNLVGIVGRTVRNKEPRYKNYWGFRKEKYLYGEHLLEEGSKKPFILVEGMLDPIRVTQELDVECVAQMGTYLSKDQAEKIINFCGSRPVITFYDGDKAGRDAENRTRELFKDKLAVFCGKLPEDADPASVDIEVLKNILENIGI